MIAVKTAERAILLCGIATLALCGVLAKKAVSHLRAVEPDSVRRSPSLPHATGAAATPSSLRGSKSGAALASRNMFCHDCQAPVSPTPAGEEATSGDVPLTQLPLVLLATSLSSSPSSSFASVRHSDGRQGAYWIGDRLPGAGAVVRIGGRAIVFRNDNRLERLALIAPPTVTRKSTAAASDGSGPPPIRADGANSYVVQRSFVTSLMDNPRLVRRPPRVRPHVVDGQVKGMSLYGISSRSLFGQLGFRNGDRLLAINGHEATSLDKLLDIYGKLKRADNFTVSLERRGSPLTISYRIQ